jgi:hypothetical protein
MDSKNELDDPVICPHCEEPVLIHQLNCRIFRHGIIKETMRQMDPHTPKEECERLFSSGLIYGCGKPFKIEILEDKITVEICDYI